MYSVELLYAITTLAVAIAQGRSPDEISALGSILTQLGDTLQTIATQVALCPPPTDKNST